MTKCSYPLCNNPSLVCPVVELPTIRTVAVNKPKLSLLVRDYYLMQKAGLSQVMAIKQHEEALKNYHEMVNTFSKTDEPTYLIGRAICETHKATYKLDDWIKASDWGYLREVARQKGYEIPPAELVIITFRPLGWTPGAKTVELIR